VWRRGLGEVTQDSAGFIETFMNFQFPLKKGRSSFSLVHVVQTGSEIHLTFHPMGTGGSSPGGKEAKKWSWPLTSNESRDQENMGLYIYSPIRLQGVVLT
jgi:hypothetical protein